MADNDEKNCFDDRFESNTQNIALSDPWISTETERTIIPMLPEAPIDPLRAMISSETYITSLERKMNKLKGKNTDKLKAKEIIETLQNVKEAQITQLLNSGNQTSAFHELSEADCSDTSVVSSIRRRLNPEQQALNPEELLSLINEDVLAKLTEQNNSDPDDINHISDHLKT